ncbi:integrase catalytic domain-containing protein [Trichonephila clavipes]|nr:integrase catalytic domain-containing protein [Trichonephila clavipes]
MNQGILFRYSPTSESEEAQLVVPINERQDILKIHQNAPNAGHYGADGTFERISKRYYLTQSIRFALNVPCDTTGKTAAYLQFGREMRTIDDVTNDFRAIIDNENFFPEITPCPLYHPGDKVWVTLHPLSNADQKKTAKFMPKRNGPYIIVTQRSPTTYEVANPNNPHVVLGPYHSSALRPSIDKEATQ